jgi:hypothetical protein
MNQSNLDISVGRKKQFRSTGQIAQEDRFGIISEIYRIKFFYQEKHSLVKKIKM